MIEYSFDCSHSQFLKLLHSFYENEGTSLLYSGDRSDLTSYLFLFPSKQISIDPDQQSPWDVLKHELHFDSSAHKIPRWIGFLSYEMAATSDHSYPIDLIKANRPLACFYQATVICTFKNNRLLICIFEEELPSTLQHSICNLAFWQELIENQPDELSPILSAQLVYESDDFLSYQRKITKAKQYIREGDCYQVNISREEHFHTKNSPCDLFLQLIKENPTPYSSFLQCGKYQIISVSPERFLSFDGTYLLTEPIKGTYPRGCTRQTDVIHAQTLLKSLKDDAELMMICDLMRNDLGRISEIGSVNCLIKKELITLSNVYHLQSKIISKPKPMHPLSYIRACFPAGSISGCPKLRSLEIIAELEKRPRHVYCGAIGYFTMNGQFDFNVAIRTAHLEKHLLKVQLGGAITVDSEETLEYQETFYKGSPFKHLFEPNKISIS